MLKFASRASGRTLLTSTACAASTGWIPVGTSLALDFTWPRFNGAVPTFTRASGGSYFDANGVMQSAPVNVWRRDHDPVTGAPLGVLIEEQRTNELTYSGQFDNSAWGATRSSITANSATAPDGTTAADKLVEDTTASDSHMVIRGFNAAASTTYTFSVFLKAAERTIAVVQIGNFANQVAANPVTINLATGEFAASDANRASVKAFANGWYRVSTTVTTIASAVVIAPSIYSAASWGSSSYSGDGVSGIYVWGAQLEAGAFPTSYIPTTSAAATRAADYPSTPTAPWLSASDQASFVFDVDIPNFDPNSNGGGANPRRHILSLTGFGGNLVYVMFQPVAGNVAQLGVISQRDGGALKTRGTPVGSPYAQGRHKVAMAFLGTSLRVSLDGAAPITVADVDPRFSAFNLMRIGQQASNTRYLNGWLRNLSHYPRVLSDAELQAASVLS